MINKGKTSTQKKTTPTTSRQAGGDKKSKPVRKVPVQAAPHSKTTANGQTRPKKRG